MYIIVESEMRHCCKFKDKDVPINQNVTDRQPTNEKLPHPAHLHIYV